VHAPTSSPTCVPCLDWRESMLQQRGKQQNPAGKSTSAGRAACRCMQVLCTRLNQACACVWRRGSQPMQTLLGRVSLWPPPYTGRDGSVTCQQPSYLREAASSPIIPGATATVLTPPVLFFRPPLLLPNSPQQPNAPSRLTKCDNQLGVPSFKPSTLVSATSGSINLCNSFNAPD
jgi:hypothetical protein